MSVCGPLMVPLDCESNPPFDIVDFAIIIAFLKNNNKKKFLQPLSVNVLSPTPNGRDIPTWSCSLFLAEHMNKNKTY